VQRHPWRRLAAWCVDWLCILGWVALVAAVAVPVVLARRGTLDPTGDLLTENLLAFVVTIAPVTAVLAVLESRGATVGKRVLGIRVRASAAAPSLGAAALRNVVKVGVPWSLGHAAVFALAQSPAAVAPWVVPALVAAYALPLASVAALFVRRGRTPYDWLCRTDVVRVAARE
jgi:uncharacterized RDD family membrane protein YckC